MPKRICKTGNEDFASFLLMAKFLLISVCSGFPSCCSSTACLLNCTNCWIPKARDRTKNSFRDLKGWNGTNKAGKNESQKAGKTIQRFLSFTGSWKENCLEICTVLMDVLLTVKTGASKNLRKQKFRPQIKNYALDRCFLWVRRWGSRRGFLKSRIMTIQSTGNLFLLSKGAQHGGILALLIKLYRPLRVMGAASAKRLLCKESHFGNCYSQIAATSLIYRRCSSGSVHLAAF